MKLTLRDLFWLTLVVAMGIGWGLDRARIAKREEAAKALEAQSNAELVFLNEMMFKMREVERNWKENKAP